MSNIYEELRIKALHSVLVGSEDYFYRKICRYFSQNFNVSLPEVEKMPADYVLLHYYESVFESLDENSNIENAIELCAPEMIEQRNKDVDNLVKILEEEQKNKKPKKVKEVEENSEEVEKLPEMNLDFGGLDDN